MPFVKWTSTLTLICLWKAQWDIRQMQMRWSTWDSSGRKGTSTSLDSLFFCFCEPIFPVHLYARISHSSFFASCDMDFRKTKPLQLFFLKLSTATAPHVWLIFTIETTHHNHGCGYLFAGLRKTRPKTYLIYGIDFLNFSKWPKWY